MTAVIDRRNVGQPPTVLETPDVWTIGPARLLSTRPGRGRVDAAAHRALHGTLPQPDRQQLQQLCADVGLVGRGGAGFAVATKLAALPNAGAAAVVVNASESEPASAKDRVLMRIAPHLVLDGAILTAKALGARTIAISVHDPVSAHSLRSAVAERQDAGQVRVDLASTGFVGGEVRAVLAGLSGGRSVPPGRRVHATTHGLDGRPTFASNVETFAQLALLTRLGACDFARTGSAVEPGTRLFTVSGAVGRPGVVEAPAGIPLTALLDAARVGPAAGVLLGGYHGTWVHPQASIPLTGAQIGAGVVVVLGPSTCALGEVARVAHWLAEQSAGQCGPCVFGLPALADDMDAIVRGDARARVAADRHLGLLPQRGACSHPDGSARFVASALRHFRLELDAHLRGGCGRPVLGQLPVAS